MWIVISLLALLVLAIVIFLRQPDSPMARRYQETVARQLALAEPATGVFTQADIAGLPEPVRRYFIRSGYLGAPRMSHMRASLSQVDFVLAPGKTIRMDYQQFNLVERPERYALISASYYGLPFEGLDSLSNGRGRMEGRLAKIIPLFDRQGASMDQSCLVTWLAECLLFPAAALQDFVSWTPIDDTHARAEITWQGLSAAGVFAFSGDSELLSFRTADRTAISLDGTEVQAEWSALFSAYHEVNGLWQPGVMQSVWHHAAGDSVYFNANGQPVAISYQ